MRIVGLSPTQDTMCGGVRFQPVPGYGMVSEEIPPHVASKFLAIDSIYQPYGGPELDKQWQAVKGKAGAQGQKDDPPPAGDGSGGEGDEGGPVKDHGGSGDDEKKDSDGGTDGPPEPVQPNTSNEELKGPQQANQRRRR